jgi:putative transposase
MNLGKKTNQNFVQIPHAKLIEMLSYKAKLAGIQVILTEESYTSKASFIDNDPIPVYKKPVRKIS